MQKTAEESSTRNLALKTITENRVGIFIVSYNAEQHIEDVLNRIPPWVAKNLAEVYN